MPLAIDLNNLVFTWPNADKPTLVIEHFAVEAGERLFLRGQSGSGKSTLLGLIAGVLRPQSGQLSVLGETLSDLSGSERDALRGERMGVIFQQFNLIPYLGVLQNVLLPLRFAKQRRARMSGSPEDEAARLLSRLGLEARWHNTPVSSLSVGQQQRVAAARALIGSPDLVIADEPTSALDSATRDQFISLLMEEVNLLNATLIFVSHDGGLASHFDRDVDLATLNTATLSEDVS